MVDKLGVKVLIVGDDFCFGKWCCGDFVLFKVMGVELNMDVKSIVSFCRFNDRVSSIFIC